MFHLLILIMIVPAMASRSRATLEIEMDAQRLLCSSLLAKLHEQMERTGHLIQLLPTDRLDWMPAIPGAWPAGMLLGHLLECLAGLCAVLVAAEPRRLAHFGELRELPVNRSCSPEQALSQVDIYRAHIDEGFALLKDSDLGRPVATVFVEQGECLLTLLLGNLEHLINHKHQLFTYLKLLGAEVSTSDLYRFHGE